jgi:hypothetical protein
VSDRAAAREIKRIADALDLLLRQIEAQPPPRAGPIEMLSLADLGARSPIESLLGDPIGRSLRLGVRALGGRLDQLGGFDLMARVAEHIADMRPECSARRLSILDFAFNGVGRWTA